MEARRIASHTGGNVALAQEADHGLTTSLEYLGCVHCGMGCWCEEWSGRTSAAAVALSQEMGVGDFTVVEFGVAGSRSFNY